MKSQQCRNFPQAFVFLWDCPVYELRVIRCVAGRQVCTTNVLSRMPQLFSGIRILVRLSRVFVCELTVACWMPGRWVPEWKSRTFRPLDTVSLGWCGPKILRPLDNGHVVPDTSSKGHRIPDVSSRDTLFMDTTSCLRVLQGDRYAPPAAAAQAGSTCCPHVLPLLALGRTFFFTSSQKKFFSALYRILKGLSHELDLGFWWRKWIDLGQNKRRA